MKDFIRSVPKSDLHVHLDGSVRLDTLIDISKKENLKLPSYTEEGLLELVFKENYNSLVEYLTCFGLTGPAMQTPENLERISYEFAKDCQKENVCYVEVRFAPQLHINSRMGLKTVLTSVNNGLERAMKEYNNTPEVKTGMRPRFLYGIIVCAMRYFGKFSEYYERFLEAHPFSDGPRNYALASYELAQGVIKIRDESALPIVGFDLAGAEDGFPASKHWKAYEYCHKNFLHKTVHAGEAYGAESIFQAITDLHADRIGHGFHLFDEDRIQDPEIKDRKKYIESLAQYISDRRITIEVCLTSNLQTIPNCKKLEDHPFKKMKDHKLSTTFCTDNRTVSRTTVSNEVEKAIKTFNINTRELKNLLTYGFKRSFFPGSYIEKRKYVREILDFYEALEIEYKVKNNIS